jgi:hypothetical protein
MYFLFLFAIVVMTRLFFLYQDYFRGRYVAGQKPV